MEETECRPMPGPMMSESPPLSHIFKRSDRYFRYVEVVSKLASGATHRCTYRACHRRAWRLMALWRLPVNVVVVDVLSLAANVNFLTNPLRAQFKDFRLAKEL